jgi:hypothetical protein
MLDACHSLGVRETVADFSAKLLFQTKAWKGLPDYSGLKLGRLHCVTFSTRIDTRSSQHAAL